jgi:PAS domain S-box-containing protein
LNHFPLLSSEKHVNLLKQMNQPIPQSVGLLLADAQRKEKKKTAKRAANRKSASTSRARKKALVEEMTRTNAHLKRQALILALLPDLVIATSLEGEVTFCSAQVGRILGHKAEDLVGVQLDQVLVPSSRDTLQKLFKRLINPGTVSSRQAQGRRGTKRRHGEQKKAAGKSDGEGDRKGNDGANASGDANSGNSGATSGANIISETSFPLSIVEVENKQSAKMPVMNAKAHEHTNANENSENSDNSTSNNSGSKQPVSSLSDSHSPADSPSEDNGAQGDVKESSKPAKTTGIEKGKDQASSGDDSSSSLSSKAENMRKANDNLDRNVRWHNQRLMGDSQKAKSDDGPKDDVTGASVTANNASARLSSLIHVTSPAARKSDKSPTQYENDQSSSDDSMLAGVEDGVEEKKKVGDTSDDSGYRESNDSREETSSSGSDSSNSKSKLGNQYDV